MSRCAPAPRRGPGVAPPLRPVYRPAMAERTLGQSVRRFLRPLLPASLRRAERVVPVLRIEGAIGIGTPFRPAVTIASLAGPLERAFKTPDAQEVALVLNCPGGAAA